MWSYIFILIKYSEMHHIIKVKWAPIAVSCSVCAYIRGRWSSNRLLIDNASPQTNRKHISSFEWAFVQDKMNLPLCRRSIAVRISFMFQFSLTLILFTLSKSESSADLLRGSEGNGFKPARRWQNTAEISMNHLSNMKSSMRHRICMLMRGYNRDKFTRGKSDRERTFAKCLA